MLKKTRYFKFFMLIIIALWACKKDDPNDNNNDTLTSGFEMKMTDARTEQAKSISINNSKVQNDIIDPVKLTKFEVSISKIRLKDADGNYTDILTSPATIDLRQFRGTVKSLLSIDLKTGMYKTIELSYSGVDVTYDTNNYKADSNGASVTIGSINYTTSAGVPNPFANEYVIEMPFEFELTDTTNIQGVRLFFDAEASCKTIAVDVPTLGIIYFAGIRDNLNLSAVLERNIQQIKHSPPLDITLTTEGDYNYYGIHTFFDFAGVGGTINSHTSQHVFRGADGSLVVDVEDMAVNNNPLSVTDVSAAGETDVRADEVFRYLTYKQKLTELGYTLESGNVYYFSLRKTWNITTDGMTYNLTRLCEPIPVYCP